MLYNIYCDESGHLENDKDNPVMVLGALYCRAEYTRKALDDIHLLKIQHGLPPTFEIKWTKISPAKIDFYKKLVQYFFDQDFLQFRVIVISNNKELDHERFQQTADEFYYKMYYLLLKEIVYPTNNYNIFMDIKDSRSNQKKEKLRQYIANNLHDYDGEIIKKIQHIRSHEVGLLQLADLLIGAVMHANKCFLQNKKYSEAKQEVINKITTHGVKLLETSLRRQRRFNVFVWRKS